MVSSGPLQHAKTPGGARNSAAGGTFRGFHQGYYLGQRVGVRLVKEQLLQLHRAAKELAGALRIRRAHTVQFAAQEINQFTELRVVVQGDPLVVHKRIGALGGSLRRPIQVQALAHHQHRQDRRVAAACRRIQEEALEAGGRLRIGHGFTLMLGHAQSLKAAQEVGVLVTGDFARELGEAQAARESIGVSDRATDQGEEGIGKR